MVDFTDSNLCIHIVNQCRNLGTYVLNVIIDYPLCEKDSLYRVYHIEMDETN
jgi:hypothetical protein